MTGISKLRRRLGSDQRGAIAVVFALLFPVLIAIVGLGVETGIWYSIKRHNQSIADVTAYSGALELVNSGSCATGWANCLAAKNDAVANNFDPTAAVNSAMRPGVGDDIIVRILACAGSKMRQATPPAMTNSLSEMTISERLARIDNAIQPYPARSAKLPMNPCR